MYHAPRYDRALLLGEKRNEILTMDEVRQFGQDSFGDPDYVCVYGLNEPGHNHGLLLGTHGWSPALEPG